MFTPCLKTWCPCWDRGRWPPRPEADTGPAATWFHLFHMWHILIGPAPPSCNITSTNQFQEHTEIQQKHKLINLLSSLKQFLHNWQKSLIKKETANIEQMNEPFSDLALFPGINCQDLNTWPIWCLGDLEVHLLPVDLTGGFPRSAILEVLRCVGQIQPSTLLTKGFWNNICYCPRFFSKF